VRNKSMNQYINKSEAVGSIHMVTTNKGMWQGTVRQGTVRYSAKQ
jgi:hypothetical protein